METFNFPYHTPTTLFPKGRAFQFGNGYTFAAKPQLPIQRRFKLHFNSIVWFLNSNGTINRTEEPAINAQLLVDFYERHYHYASFIYPHPIYGNITVKFDTDHPLEIPKSIEGGSGATDGFEIVLVEQPL